MPQNRKPIYKYPPGYKPLGHLAFNCESGVIYARETDFVKRLAMLRAANRFLKPLGKCTAENQSGLITIILFGDFFEIALAPSVLTDGKHPGTAKRFLDFLARNTDFTLRYIACLRKAAANAHKSAFAKAVDALRNLETVRIFDGKKRIPISNANDKDVAQEIGVNPGAVYHARRALNLFDSGMWGDSMKPKKQKRI
jgi:hypothetical protein